MRLLAAMLLLLAIQGELCADDAAGANSLAGLTDVRVVVEGIGKEAEAAGLKRAEVRTMVETAAKSAGLRVLSVAERARGMPTLYLSMVVIPASKNDKELFVYSIELSLIQEVRLSRSPGVRVNSATWRPTGTVGTIPAGDVAKLKGMVEACLKKFAEDLKKANE